MRIVFRCGCRNRKQNENQQRANNLRRNADGQRKHYEEENRDQLVIPLIIFRTLGIKGIEGQFSESKENQNQ